MCDATVTATCDYFDAGISLVTQSSFEPDAAPSDCEYGVPERSADGGVESIIRLMYTCTLQVTKAGFRPATVANVAPTNGSCTMNQQQVVEVKIQPG